MVHQPQAWSFDPAVKEQGHKIRVYASVKPECKIYSDILSGSGIFTKSVCVSKGFEGSYTP